MSEPGSASVLILHARADAAACRALLAHLSVYQRTGRLRVFTRAQLVPAMSVQKQLEQEVHQAQIILLLISSDFLAGHGAELELALLAQRRGAVLLPILCRPALLAGTPLGGLSTWPLNKPISLSRNKDQIWAELARLVLKTAETLGPGGGSAPIAVLFLSASPLDAHPVDVGRELKKIAQSLKAFESRERFELVQEWAVGIDELTRLLLKHRPTIVHFSGHGARSEQIVLERDGGQGHPVPSEPLARLFATLNTNGQIRCVVLSACYAEGQAQLLSRYVDCVIGISGKIHELSAAAFAAGFYTGLAAGKSFATAFELGRVQLALENQHPAELHLLVRPGTDAAHLSLFSIPAQRS